MQNLGLTHFHVTADCYPAMVRRVTASRAYAVTATCTAAMSKVAFHFRAFATSFSCVVAMSRIKIRVRAFAVEVSAWAVLVSNTFIGDVFKKVLRVIRREDPIAVWRDPLWWVEIPVGGTLLREGGVWSLVEAPTTERVRAAEFAFLGGHDQELTSGQVSELTSAGYGAFIVDVPIIRRGY